MMRPGIRRGSHPSLLPMAMMAWLTSFARATASATSGRSPTCRARSSTGNETRGLPRPASLVLGFRLALAARLPQGLCGSRRRRGCLLRHRARPVLGQELPEALVEAPSLIVIRYA